MTAHWAKETISDASRWPDAGLVREGLRLFEQLPRTASTEVLLATDLHAGTSCKRNESLGSSSIPSPSSGILPTMQRNISSTAKRECAQILLARSAALLTCSRSITSASGFGCSRVPQRSPATDGMSTQSPWPGLWFEGAGCQRNKARHAASRL